MSATIQVIIGLGNPGAEHEKTRHNAGFWLVDSLAEQESVSWRQEKKLFGLVSDMRFNNNVIRLLKPNTFMNLSGQAVNSIIKYFDLTAENCLIVHDDIDLEVGQVKLKFSGGHGGHNGLRSIFQSIGTRDFYRLRIGVGRPKNSHEVHSYVLKQASKGEQSILNNSIDDALEQIPEILQGNISKATQSLHTKEDHGI